MKRIYNFSPKRKKKLFGSPSLTLILILINVIAFVIIWGALSFGMISESFFNENIVLSLKNIQQLKLWTFITSMFMHGGSFHIFANMFSLFFVGGLVEKILGKKRYFYFYMFSGLLAGLLYLLSEILFPSGLGAVGASGALFGLVGLLVLLTPNLPVFVMFIPIPIKMKYAGPGILVLLWLVSIAGNVPIGNSAHFGGLLAGIIYGLYLKNKYKRKTKYLSKYFS